jgi:hypothetical protein
MNRRECASCTACCTIMPVEEISKAAHVRCRYLKAAKRCSVYGQPKMPHSCQLWNCRWLVDDEHGDLARPDRSHFVIDIMPDIVRAKDNATGAEHEFDVIVVWTERGHDDAHRDPGLRRYVDRAAKPMLVRFADGDAMLICPPSRSDNQGWLEYPRHQPDKNFKGFAKRLRERTRLMDARANQSVGDEGPPAGRELTDR